MAIVITLGSDNRLVFEKPNGAKNIMKNPITAETKNDILQNKSICKHMSLDTINDIHDIEKVYEGFDGVAGWQKLESYYI